jgi:hypothetical protein
MCIRDLNIELEKLGLTETVDSAQAATATSHKEWLDIQSVDVSVQKKPVQFVFFRQSSKGKTGERENTESK